MSNIPPIPEPMNKPKLKPLTKKEKFQAWVGFLGCGSIAVFVIYNLFLSCTNVVASPYKECWHDAMNRARVEAENLEDQGQLNAAKRVRRSMVDFAEKSCLSLK